MTPISLSATRVKWRWIEVWKTDSRLIAVFRSTGLVPFDLSSVPEVSFAVSTEPEGQPPTANPCDPDIKVLRMFVRDRQQIEILGIVDVSGNGQGA